MIPFFDLGRALDPIWGDAYRAVRRVVERRQFLRGMYVRRFEEAFADFVGARYCVAVSSGSAAITLALRACGVPDKENVWTQALSCPAVAASLVAAGGRPVYVDVDRDTCLAVPGAYHGLGSRSVVLAVHLYGRVADLSGLPRPALVEDCAQALCAEGAGRSGVAACWSFYPTKPLGAWGDAGAVTTDDEGLAAEVRSLRHYGCSGETHDWSVSRWGWNARMDEVQAAVLLAKLPRVQEWNRQRARIAAAYRRWLPDEILGGWRSGPESNHIFPVFLPDGTRDRFRREMAARGVETAVHYPVALPDLEASRASGRGWERRIARTLAETEVSLPIWPGMRESEVRRVAWSAVESWSAIQRALDRTPAPV